MGFCEKNRFDLWPGYVRRSVKRWSSSSLRFRWEIGRVLPRHQMVDHFSLRSQRTKSQRKGLWTLMPHISFSDVDIWHWTSKYGQKEGSLIELDFAEQKAVGCWHRSKRDSATAHIFEVGYVSELFLLMTMVVGRLAGKDMNVAGMSSISKVLNGILESFILIWEDHICHLWVRSATICGSSVWLRNKSLGSHISFRWSAAGRCSGPTVERAVARFERSSPRCGWFGDGFGVKAKGLGVRS